MKTRIAIVAAGTAVCLCSIFAGPFHSATAAASPGREPGGSGGKQRLRRDQRLEREQRLTLRTLEDLRFLRAQVAGEQAELEREIDAVAPLEAIIREDDLRAMGDLLDGYDDWLAENEAAADGNLARLSSLKPTGDGRWPEHYATLAKGFRQFAGNMAQLSERFDGEGKRVAALVDRRRQLRARLDALDAQRGRRDERGEAASRHRSRVQALAAELAALPNINEDALKHYYTAGERARAEAAWLAAKAEEYSFLADTAAVLCAPRPRDRAYLDAAVMRIRRITDRVTARLAKRIDDLDRRLERIQPAGTIQELQRSAELRDVYRSQKQRYREYIDRLKAQSGALEADLEELADSEGR